MEPLFPFGIPLDNSDFDFFNFRHHQVQNFEILNQSERDQNFAANFQKHQKQKRKLTKYIEIEQNWSIFIGT